MTRRRVVRLTAITLVCLAFVAGLFVSYQHSFGPRTVTAIFKNANAIYTGDDVRVAGVKVGTITAIQPAATSVRLTMKVARSVSIPADAKAVIVAQNLVAARYVQLTPVYRKGMGDVMADGSIIPVERTAVPVEWDEVKEQLDRLATELGPATGKPTGSAGRFIESAANALGGNGDKLRQALAQLSGVSRVLAEGSGDIADVIRNLQTFVTALRDSSEQIVEFEDRLATLSSVLDGSKSDLNAALTDLSVAVGDVQRFVASTRDKSAEQIERLADVTQNLADRKNDVEQLLHVFPTAVANFYNVYDPVSGTFAGVPTVNNFSNPIQFICAAMAATTPGNPADGVKKCAEYLGPVLRIFNPQTLVNLNYVPIPLNPILGPVPSPDDIIYTEPKLDPRNIVEPPPAGAPPPPSGLPAERPSS
jgi:phospholipid/cholesterol/gamma-HCH transport system substrate-binding protein